LQIVQMINPLRNKNLFNDASRLGDLAARWLARIREIWKRQIKRAKMLE
jgi:hypothetical protein